MTILSKFQRVHNTKLENHGKVICYIVNSDFHFATYAREKCGARGDAGWGFKRDESVNGAITNYIGACCSVVQPHWKYLA